MSRGLGEVAFSITCPDCYRPFRVVLPTAFAIWTGQRNSGKIVAMDGRFQRGTPKPAASKKGAHHKITNELRLLLDDLGCNPIEGLALIAMNGKYPVEVRRRAYADLVRYIHPQLQAVAVSGPNDGPIQTESVSARELLLARIAELREGRGNQGG